MKESIHYLLMSDHMLVQKALLGSIKESGLTLGQPKILDYLKTITAVYKRILRQAVTLSLRP